MGVNNKIHVLHVDDREDVRKLVALLLTHHGYTTISAASIEEAKERLNELLSNGSNLAVVVDGNIAPGYTRDGEKFARLLMNGHGSRIKVAIYTNDSRIHEDEEVRVIQKGDINGLLNFLAS